MSKAQHRKLGPGHGTVSPGASVHTGLKVAMGLEGKTLGLDTVELSDDPVESPVTELGDDLRVTGVSKAELLEALKLHAAAKEIRTQHGRAMAAGIEQVAAQARVDLVDPVPVEQARRRVSLQQRLLATPVYSYKTLAEVRGDAKVSTTRTWVSRVRGQHRMFTVEHGGSILIPAFQLTGEGKPREHLGALLQALMPVVDDWTLWVWLTSSTPLLSGGVPAEVAADNPKRALKAAERFVARNRAA